MSPEDNPADDCLYEVALEDEFRRVMQNNVVARHGYDTARHFGLDETARLKAAIVALSNAHDNLMEQRRPTVFGGARVPDGLKRSTEDS